MNEVPNVEDRTIKHKYKFLIAWGVGETFRDAMQCKRQAFSMFVDGSPDKQGKLLEGFSQVVLSPEAFLNRVIASDACVIVFTPGFQEVKDYLTQFGFIHGENLIYFLDLDVYRPVVDVMSKEREFNFLSTICTHGDNVLDIGANVGLYTLKLASLVGAKMQGEEDGRVYSFEPEKRNFRQLSYHVKLFGIANAQCLNVAVGSKDRESVEMTLPHMNGLPLRGHCFISDPDVGNSHGIEYDSDYGVMREIRTSTSSGERFYVRQVTLDGFLGDMSLRWSFIKIDVEGAEETVLSGARNLLIRDKPIVQIELVMGAVQMKSIRSLMADLGYELYLLGHEMKLFKIRGPSLVKGVKNYYFVHQADERLSAGGE